MAVGGGYTYHVSVLRSARFTAAVSMTVVAGCSLLYGPGEGLVTAGAGEPTEASVDDASPASDATPPEHEGGDASDPTPAEGGALLPCPDARFVDTFDDDDLLSPFWTSINEGGGVVAITQAEGAAAAGALRVAATPSGTGNRSPHLRLARGPSPSAWTFCLSFAMRLASPTVGFVQGPRIVTSAEVESALVYLAFAERDLYVGQYADLCDDGGPGCDVDSTAEPIATLTDQWTTITMVGAVGATTKHPFGTLAITVGSAPSKLVPLLVRLSGLPYTNLRLGLTRVGANEAADVLIDDVRYGDSLP